MGRRLLCLAGRHRTIRVVTGMDLHAVDLAGGISGRITDSRYECRDCHKPTRNPLRGIRARWWHRPRWWWPVARVGWPSRTYPPDKAGRWWLWVGPYMLGWRMP